MCKQDTVWVALGRLGIVSMCINQNWYSRQWGSLLFFLFFDDFLRKTWLFFPIIQCGFTPKIPKKLIFPQISTIIQGTLLTFLPKKVIFSSKCACLSSTNLTFLNNNPVCFYTKNSQNVHFPSNCAYNTGHFIDFSSKKSDFFLKMRLHIEHYFDFFAQLSSFFVHQKFPKS